MNLYNIVDQGSGNIVGMCSSAMLQKATTTIDQCRVLAGMDVISSGMLKDMDLETAMFTFPFKLVKV